MTLEPAELPGQDPQPAGPAPSFAALQTPLASDQPAAASAPPTHQPGGAPEQHEQEEVLESFYESLGEDPPLSVCAYGESEEQHVGGMHQSAPGLDLTGAAISQELHIHKPGEQPGGEAEHLGACEVGRGVACRELTLVGAACWPAGAGCQFCPGV